MGSTLSSRRPATRRWALLAAGATGAAVVARHFLRVSVHGPSMAPTLAEGDRLVALRLPRWWRLRPGDLVAVEGVGSTEGRLLIKRVVEVTGSAVTVRGDNPEHSEDSRSFGPLPRRGVVARALYRYWPPERSGLLR